MPSLALAFFVSHFACFLRSRAAIAFIFRHYLPYYCRHAHFIFGLLFSFHAAVFDAASAALPRRHQMPLRCLFRCRRRHYCHAFIAGACHAMPPCHAASPPADAMPPGFAISVFSCFFMPPRLQISSPLLTLTYEALHYADAARCHTLSAMLQPHRGQSAIGLTTDFHGQFFTTSFFNSYAITTTNTSAISGFFILSSPKSLLFQIFATPLPITTVFSLSA